MKMRSSYDVGGKSKKEASILGSIHVITPKELHCHFVLLEIFVSHGLKCNFHFANLVPVQFLSLKIKKFQLVS